MGWPLECETSGQYPGGFSFCFKKVSKKFQIVGWFITFATTDQNHLKINIMRKVIYQVWIPQRFETKENGKPDYTKPIKEDTAHKFAEPESGYFHGWGKVVHEDSKTIVEETVGLVEDVKTGYIHKVEPSKLRFVQPPPNTPADTLARARNMARQREINAQLAQKAN